MKGFRARWRSEPYCINEGSTSGHPILLDTDPGQREPEIHGEADITLDREVGEEGDMQAGSPRVRLHTDVESQARGTGSADPVLLQEVHRVSDEPWEAGIWSTVFAGQVPFGLSHPMNEPLRPVPMPAASTRSAPESVPPAPLKDLTARRLKTAKIRASNEDIRASALHKLKVLVLLDPGATRAGSLMKNKVGLTLDAEEAVQILSDIMAPKSTGTLCKRIGALWRYAQFLSSHGGLGPFTAPEPELHRYLQTLRESDAGATSGASLLEALRFANHLLGFQRIPIADLDSPRVEGVSYSLFMKKRRRAPAPPLPVVVVRHLLSACLDTALSDELRLISGHLALCVFAVARRSDLRLMDGTHVDESGTITVFEAESKDYKTAYSKEQKVELLPFIGLGSWPGQPSWALCLQDLRHKRNIQGGLPSLGRTGWLDTPMVTSEATAFLREIAQNVLEASIRLYRCQTAST